VFDKFLLRNKKNLSSKISKEYFNKGMNLIRIEENLCKCIKNNLNKFCGKENDDSFSK